MKYSSKVILLERDKKRVEHFEKHIKIKIPEIEIFKAVDSKTSKIEELFSQYNISLSKNYKNEAIRGQLGCSLSHISIWKEMIEKNIENMLILEDDVFIPNNFQEKMKNILDELPKNYDFLYLFVHPYNYKNIDENSEYYLKNKKLIVKAYKTFGTVGYLISKNGAQKLLNKFQILETTIDEQLKNLIEDIKSFSVKKEFLSTVGQLLQTSEISNKLSSNIWNTEIYKKIKYFSILGERCSGTNYLKNLLLLNFEIENKQHENKHFFGKANYENIDDTLFIGIVRNPHSWINSLYKNPWHLSDEIKNNKEKFLNNKFMSYNYENQLIDKNIYTDKIYENIFECRYTKLKYLLEDMPKKNKNYILIRYEDLRDNFEKTMLEFKKFDLTPKKNFPINIENYKNSKEKKFQIDTNYIFLKNEIYNHSNFKSIYEKKLNYMPHFLQNLNILVINIDTKQERLKKITQMLSKFNLTFERIKGFVPTEEDIKNTDLINIDQLYHIWKNSEIYIKGVLGCKISHINAIKRARELEGYTLILEDDVFFENDCFEIFDKSWNELKKFDWDIFYLGANLRGKTELVSKYVGKTTNAVSFCAYIVNNKSISKILNIIEKTQNEVDASIAEASVRGEIKQYIIWPMIVYVKDDISSNTGLHTNIRWRDRYLNMFNN